MNKLKTTLTTIFSCLIACAVILSGAHAKEVVGGRLAAKDDGALAKSTVKSSGDAAAKAVGELHTHVDKTSLKVMAKSAVDSSILARERETKAGFAPLERTASIRFLEAIFMLRLALAGAVA